MSSKQMIRRFSVQPENLEHASESKGSDFFLEVSPYDMPNVMRWQGNADPPELTIEFEYIDNEPTVSILTSVGVHLVLGRHTGKVIRLVVPVSEWPPESGDIAALREKLCTAIRDAPQRSVTAVMNRKVVGEIVERGFDLFFEPKHRSA